MIARQENSQARRATVPIDESIRPAFYAAVMSVALHGASEVEQRSVGYAGRDRRRRLVARRNGLCVLWQTSLGLRFSELARLRVGDLNGSFVYVIRSKGGASGFRKMASTPEFCLVNETVSWRREFVELCGVDSKLLLPSTRGSSLNNDQYNRFLREIGGCFGVRVSSHSFRDTAAGLLWSGSQSVDLVQAFLGHRSKSSTEKYLAKKRTESTSIDVARLLDVQG